MDQVGINSGDIFGHGIDVQFCVQGVTRVHHNQVAWFGTCHRFDGRVVAVEAIGIIFAMLTHLLDFHNRLGFDICGVCQCAGGSSTQQHGCNGWFDLEHKYPLLYERTGYLPNLQMSSISLQFISLLKINHSTTKGKVFINLNVFIFREGNEKQVPWQGLSLHARQSRCVAPLAPTACIQGRAAQARDLHGQQVGNGADATAAMVNH